MARPRTPRTGRYDHLKAQVRRAYETTESSIRSLADTFGIATETTIRNWRDAEGWTKDIEAIRARLVTRAMAMPGPPDSPVVFTIDAVTSRTYDRYTPTPEPPQAQGEADTHFAGVGRMVHPEPPQAQGEADTQDAPDHAAAEPEPTPDREPTAEPTPDPVPQNTQADEAARATSTPAGIPILDGKEWPWGFGVYLPPKGFPPLPGQSIDDGKPKGGPNGARTARRATKRAEKIAPLPEETADAHSRVLEEAGVSEVDPSDDGKVRTTAHSAHHAHSTPRAPSAPRKAPHASVTAPMDRRDAEAAIDIATARGLAEIQAAAIRRHSHIADRLLETATTMLSLAQVAMLPLPPDASEADIEFQQRAIQRLTAVNGDKDTLAGIAKAASAIANAAVLIQRKSLGMDSAMANDLITPNKLDGKESTKALSHLPLDLLEKLREHVLRKTRERPTGTLMRAIEKREEAEGVRIDGTPIPPESPEDEDDADGE